MSLLPCSNRKQSGENYNAGPDKWRWMMDLNIIAWVLLLGIIIWNISRFVRLTRTCEDFWQEKCSWQLHLLLIDTVPGWASQKLCNLYIGHAPWLWTLNWPDFFIWQIILGKQRRFPADLDETFSKELLQCAGDIPTAEGNTMCTNDFYEGGHATISPHVLYNQHYYNPRKLENLIICFWWL